VAVLGQTLDPTTQEKWAIELPRPARIDVTKGKGRLTMGMYEKNQWLGLRDPNAGVGLGDPLMTTVWGYGANSRSATYPGPTFIAMKDVPVDIRWNNNLPGSGHILPVDNTMHMAHPHDVPAADFYAAGNVPTVVHLHGGHTESASDGIPEAWFTQGFSDKGPFFVKRTYHYDNDQEAGTLWYHDHALGITRLNVYAGLAGYYFLRDQDELDMTTTKKQSRELPHPDYEYEFVIQDRMFDMNGQLFLPSEPGVESTSEPYDLPVPGTWEAVGPPPATSIVAEFFGDHILVNGVLWPKLTVEPRKYRFRLLNGSDSRFYILELHNSDGGSKGDYAMPFIVVGTDGIDEAVESVKAGKMAATVAQDPYAMGVTAVQTLQKLIKGEEVEFRFRRHRGRTGPRAEERREKEPAGNGEL